MPEVTFTPATGLLIDDGVRPRSVASPALEAVRGADVPPNRSARVFAAGDHRIALHYVGDSFRRLSLTLLDHAEISIFVHDSDTLRKWVVRADDGGYQALEVHGRERSAPTPLRSLPRTGNPTLGELLSGQTDGVDLDLVITVEVAELDVQQLGLKRNWVVDGIESRLPGASGEALPMAVVTPIAYM